MGHFAKIDGNIEAVPTRDEEGNVAWTVRVDGKELGEHLFHKNPPYENWDVGDKTMRIALHETWHLRGLPDNYICDVGVRLIGYVKPNGSRRAFQFSASRIGSGPFHYGGGCDDMDITVDIEHGAFRSQTDRDAFEETMTDYLTENYDFELKHE